MNPSRFRAFAPSRLQPMEEKENKQKEIELRSEEVQEVMGAIPSWILRWGITVLFLVVATLAVGSCFFRYPDVIVSEMTLTGRSPVAPIVARASGKISRLYIEVETANQLIEQTKVISSKIQSFINTRRK